MESITKLIYANVAECGSDKSLSQWDFIIFYCTSASPIGVLLSGLFICLENIMKGGKNMTIKSVSIFLCLILLILCAGCASSDEQSTDLLAKYAELDEKELLETCNEITLT